MREAKLGFCNPRACFKNNEILKIRADLALGKPAKQIARENGVTPTAIFLIKHRKTWKHI